MNDFSFTPFPFNVTPASLLFDVSPVASNISHGWVPSCTQPDCMPTANWTTSSVGSSFYLQYWGWGVALEGTLKGNMTVELFQDGEAVPELWNPSDGVLFQVPAGPNDESYLRNTTLKVLDASPGAELTISQARINGSTRLKELPYSPVRWIVPSNDYRMNYTGFVKEPSLAHGGSPTTYMSSKIGDKVVMQFNASTFLVYGPCGPTTGLMKVAIDGLESTVNTTKPFSSNDCILFQALGLKYSPGRVDHIFSIEYAGGGPIGFDRTDVFWLDIDQQKADDQIDWTDTKTVGIIIGIVMVSLLALVGFWLWLRKTAWWKHWSYEVSYALWR